MLKSRNRAFFSAGTKLSGLVWHHRTILRWWCIRLTCQVDSHLRDDIKAPLGSSQTKFQKDRFLSGRWPIIAFLCLFLFRSLLRLPSFLSKNKNQPQFTKLVLCHSTGSLWKKAKSTVPVVARVLHRVTLFPTVIDSRAMRTCIRQLSQVAFSWSCVNNWGKRSMHT